MLHDLVPRFRILKFKFLIPEESEVVILLVFFGLLYTLCGAAIFQWCEEQNEIDKLQKFQKENTTLFGKFENGTANETDIKKLMKLYEQAINDGLPLNGRKKWTYTGSLFFAGTIGIGMMQ